MKTDRLYITHILERLAKIREYKEDMAEYPEVSSAFEEAILRSLEIIGEAAKKISKPLKTRIRIFRGRNWAPSGTF